MRRRRRGSGSIFKRADGIWVCRRDLGIVDGKRLRPQVTSQRFCEAVKKFSEMHPYRPEFSIPVGTAPNRVEAMRAARALGRHTAQEWFALVRSVNSECYYCERKCQRLPSYMRITKDHRIPVSRGGSDAIDNIVVACQRCNSEKSDMTDVEFLSMWRPRREAMI